MMRKLQKLIRVVLPALLATCLAFALAACATNYTVTFELGYGDEEATTQEVAEGALIEEPADPVRTGYEFDGWFADGEAWDFDSDTVSADITLTAQWTRLYTVTYALGGGTADYPLTVTVRDGAEVTLPEAPEPAEEGKEFSGWQVGTDGAVKTPGEKVTVTADTTITAVYGDAVFTVTYNKQDDTEVSADYVYGTEFTLPESDNDSYTVEWKANGETYKPGDKITVTGDLTIEGVYTGIYFDVTYYGYDGETVYVEEVLRGEASVYDTAAPSTWAGFLSWDKSDEGLQAVTEDMSVYATWEYEQSDEALFYFEANKDNSGYYVEFSLDYMGTVPETVYLPVVHDGKPVVGIKGYSDGQSSAFSTMGATTVVIPNAYTVIPSQAFAMSATLETVLFAETGGTQFEGKTLTAIESNAFYYANKLSAFNTTEEGTFNLPSGLVTIGNYAFQFDGECEKDKTAVDDVLSPFTKFTFEAGNTALESIGVAAFKYAGFTGKLTIPASVKEIKGTGTNFSNTNGAFMYARRITELAFEEGSVIESIGAGAFRSGDATGIMSGLLAKVTFPASLRTIGALAFARQQLEEVTLTEGLESIGWSAFRVYSTDENSVVSLTIPSTVKTIDEYAFANWGSAATFTIAPGSRLESIGGYAFQALGIQGALVLPEGLTTIGDNAFEDAEGLTALTIPSTVTSIGDYAFAGTPALGGVTFTDDGTAPLSIGEYAFQGTSFTSTTAEEGKAEALTSFAFPARTASIGKCVLNYRTLLTQVTFNETPAGSEPVELTFAEYALAGVSSSSASASNPYSVMPIKSLTIPARTVSIGKYAFQGLFMLESITFEEGFTAEIPEYMARYCYSLKSITLPEGVTTIKQYAFSAYYSSSAYKYYAATAGENGTATAEVLDSASASGNKGLTSLTIPSTVTTIGNYAFQNFTNLAALTFESSASGEGAMTIGNTNFGMTNANITAQADLTVSIGNTVQSIGNNFAQRAKLAAVTFADDAKIAEIGSSSFSGESGKDYGQTITAVELPASLSELDSTAFRYLPKLASFTVAAGNQAYSAENGILYQTVKDVKTLINYPSGKADTTLTLENVAVGDDALLGNAAITELTLSNVSSVGDDAFSKMTALEAVTFTGTTATTFGANTFKDNTALETVTLNDSITALGNSFFNGCTSLVTIDLKEVATLGTGTFQNCTAFTGYTGGKLTALPQNTFNGAASLTQFDLVGKGILEVGANVFQGSGLTSIDFTGSGVTTLGNAVFQNCYSLVTADLSGVTTLGNNTFYGCSSLVWLDMSDVTSMGTNTFNMYMLDDEVMPALEEIVIPAGITVLTQNMFRGVDGLKTLVLEGDAVKTFEKTGQFDETPFATAGNEGAAIFVADDLLTAYQTDAGWADYVSYIKPMSARASYKLTYELAEGEGTAPEAVTVTQGATNIAVAAPDEREGYEFIGWTVKGTEEVLQPGTRYYVRADVTLVGSWRSTADAADVTFALGDHAAADAEAPETIESYVGGTIRLPEAPAAADGYDFAGWLAEGGEEPLAAGSEYNVTASVTFTAQWTLHVHAWGEIAYADNTVSRTCETCGEQQSATVSAEGAVISADDFTASETGFTFDLPAAVPAAEEGTFFKSYLLDGIAYYPGEKVDVAFGGTAALTAVFEDLYTQTTESDVQLLTWPTEGSRAFTLAEGRSITLTAGLSGTFTEDAFHEGVYAQVFFGGTLGGTNDVVFRADQWYFSGNYNPDNAHSNVSRDSIEGTIGTAAEFNAAKLANQTKIELTKTGSSVEIVYSVGEYLVTTYTISGLSAEEITVYFLYEGANISVNNVAVTYSVVNASENQWPTADAPLTIGNLNAGYTPSVWTGAIAKGEKVVFSGHMTGKAEENYHTILTGLYSVGSAIVNFRGDNYVLGSAEAEGWKVEQANTSSSNWDAFRATIADCDVTVTVDWTDEAKIVVTMTFGEHVQTYTITAAEGTLAGSYVLNFGFEASQTVFTSVVRTSVKA